MPAGGEATGRTASSRLTERHVLALGLALAGLLVGAAAVAGGTALVGGGSSWAAIHLALAGAATVAIGTFMPHFAVTLAGTRPQPPSERVATLGLLGSGAVAVVAGVLAVGGWLAGIGAAVMLVGLGLVARQVAAPLRDPLARRHHVVTVTYGAALVMLAAAVVLGGLGAVGVPEVLQAWARLRPAHAWLGLFGAVSLTIFATLVYLAPTVMGARIRPSPALAVGVAGMTIGPVVVVTGFVVDAAPVVGAGMGLALVGAIGQLAYVLDAVRRRGRFTTEHDWRRVAWVHLAAGAGWYLLAMAAALAAIVRGGPVSGWSIGAIAVPTVGGWMLQELIGSWTHLVPSVTPGTPADHARQRRVLAVASRSRLVALNLGIGLVWLGASVTWAERLLLPGAVLAGATAVLSLTLLARALTIGRY
jgi:hypothetical protein